VQVGGVLVLETLAEALLNTPHVHTYLHTGGLRRRDCMIGT
jgi:hypothetical protein